MKLLEDQYSPNSRYLMAKVTNKSNKTLNFRESVVGKDSHGNNLDGLAGVERGPVAPNQTVVLWETFMMKNHITTTILIMKYMQQTLRMNLQILI